MPRHKLLFSLLLSSRLLPVFAQGFTDSPRISQLAYSYRETTTEVELKEALPIFTGRSYLRNGTRARGTAFFLSDSLMTGAIRFEDHLYPHLLLQYDLVNDLLVIPNAGENGFISVTREKTAGFEISGHHFINLSPGEAVKGLPVQGFYEEFYSGSARLLIRREKKLMLSSGSTEDVAHYRESVAYYVWRNGTVYPADNFKSACAAFGEKKAQLFEYGKTMHLDFKKNPEATLTSLARFYETLSL